MRKADIFVALFFLSIGILSVVDSVRIGFVWGMSGPKAGFFPFYLGVGLIVCSLIVLFNVARQYKKDGSGKPLMPEGALKYLALAVIPATLMVVITEFIGLHISAALYLTFYMRVVGKVGWVKTILVSLLAPLSLYIAFDKLFLVPLPQGLWGAKLLRF